MFSILEVFTDTLLYWFPLYYSAKVLFLLWCQAPIFNGAEYLYTRFLRSWFLANQHIIDSYLHQASAIGNQAITTATNQASTIVANNITNNNNKPKEK